MTDLQLVAFIAYAFVIGMCAGCACTIWLARAWHRFRVERTPPIQVLSFRKRTDIRA